MNGKVFIISTTPNCHLNYTRYAHLNEKCWTVGFERVMMLVQRFRTLRFQDQSSNPASHTVTLRGKQGYLCNTV